MLELTSLQFAFYTSDLAWSIKLGTMNVCDGGFVLKLAVKKEPGSVTTCVKTPTETVNITPYKPTEIFEINLFVYFELHR